ncbi:MAG: family 16 glycoside hydrolase [Polyangiales bacterium]
MNARLVSHAPRRRHLACVLALLAASGCGRDAPAAPPARGHDPWVLRATLDQRPRMLILALAPDLWVAYDAGRASLYRVSSSGVNFDGAVYNTHHGPQPVTQGASLTSTFDEPWHLVRGRDDLRPTVRYQGHRFDGPHVVLAYTLTLADDPSVAVTIEERPEAVVDAKKRPALERRFRVAGVPKGVDVVMDFNAKALGTTDGVTLVTRGDELTGKLKLAPDEETKLLLEFTPDKPAEVDPKRAAMPRGERLIAEGDCATCHNATSKTVGPSYTEVAERYRSNPQTVAGLAKKIRQGGAEQWGDAAMVAHPNLTPDDATAIASYILDTFDPGDKAGTEVTHPLSATPAQKPEFDPAMLTPGLTVELFEVGHGVDALPQLEESAPANAVFTASDLTFADAAAFRRALPSTGFIVRVRGWLEAPEEGTYDFRVEHDGVVELKIDEWALVRDVPARARRWSPWVSIDLTQGLHPVEVVYASASATPHLALHWAPPGQSLAPVPPSALKGIAPTTPALADGLKGYRLLAGVPGRGRPLTGVHPGYTLHPLRPHGFKPMVGGMDLRGPDELLVSTWDSRGAVYALRNLRADDPERIEVKRIADGLAEPLGLKVVGAHTYVLQKHELTRLIDGDHDGLIDQYQTVSNAWGSTGNFHEFAFGLEHREGWFYAALSIGVEPGGAALRPQHQDRGKVVRIAEKTGAVEPIAKGVRTPNGLAFGPEGALFVTDNEGDWLPANKLMHIEPGKFYGSYSVDPEGTRDTPVAPPALWLPVEEIATSPTQPLLLAHGPYRGQMLYGDVTYGGLTRVALQKVDGQYQGCALPFSQGLEGGVNRLVAGPDGTLYVGGIGGPGTWAQEHKLWYGLERLAPSGATAFEMHDLTVRSDGIEIAFTEPLHAAYGGAPSDYALRAWHYVPTSEYGGPKVDEHPLAVETVRVSEDRTHVFLGVPALKVGEVVHVSLREPPIAASGRAVWSTDAYCTLNRIPSGEPGTRFADQPPVRANTLADAERAAGFQLLFDGRGTRGWRGHRGARPDGWRVQDGWLRTMPGRGVDLVTVDAYDDFELELEWRADKGANGGVFYRAGDDRAELWQAAAELQTLDDAGHPDGRAPLHRAGALYDLYAPNADVVREAGAVNRVRVIARGTKVEHWLNGHKVLAYDTASDDYARQLAASKFRDLPGFGKRARGRIGLQHHGEAMAYRNIKVRPLPHTEGVEAEHVSTAK